MKANGRRRWRKWAKKNGAGRGDFADYRRFRRHGDSTYEGVVGMRPGVVPSRPFSPRSLVGMTMGARKRGARWELAANTPSSQESRLAMAGTLRAWYRIGQRLRPCLVCLWAKCKLPCDVCSTCDGSGVIPARSQVNAGKALAVEPAAPID